MGMVQWRNAGYEKLRQPTPERGETIGPSLVRHATNEEVVRNSVGTGKIWVQRDRKRCPDEQGY